MFFSEETRQFSAKRASKSRFRNSRRSTRGQKVARLPQTGKAQNRLGRLAVVSALQFDFSLHLIMLRGSSQVQLVRRSPRGHVRLSASAKKPKLARGNTRTKAALEGQEFLASMSFDPSVKRSIIAPRRFTIVLKGQQVRKHRVEPVVVGTIKNGQTRQKANLNKQVRAPKKGAVRAKAATRPIPIPTKTVSAAPRVALAIPPIPPFRQAPGALRQVPAVWKFQSKAPAFALHVTPDSGTC